MPEAFNPAASTGGPARATLLRDRRRENRKPMQTPAKLTIVDGSGAGNVHDVMTRDLSFSGVSFLLRDELSVGQNCRIDMNGNGNPKQSRLCEVIRARALSNGKYEMAVKFRG